MPIGQRCNPLLSSARPHYLPLSICASQSPTQVSNAFDCTKRIASFCQGGNQPEVSVLWTYGLHSAIRLPTRVCLYTGPGGVLRSEEQHKVTSRTQGFCEAAVYCGSPLTHVVCLTLPGTPPAACCCCSASPSRPVNCKWLDSTPCSSHRRYRSPSREQWREWVSTKSTGALPSKLLLHSHYSDINGNFCVDAKCSIVFCVRFEYVRECAALQWRVSEVHVLAVPGSDLSVPPTADDADMVGRPCSQLIM